jgi:hypothetical protein
MDYFNKIQKVEPPLFLFTRIQQQIKNTDSTSVSKKYVWATALSLILIVIINVFVLTKSMAAKSKKPNLAESMNMMPSNNLYQ